VTDELGGDDFSSFEIDPVKLAKEIASKESVRNGHDKTAKPSAWPDPEPLFEPQEVERAYPLDALPSLISAAIEEYRTYGQQPLSLLASSAMATVSLASQGLADVARDSYLVGPISLNFVAVAISGERKTSGDRHFNRPVREWQDKQRESLAAEAGQARAAIKSWEAQCEGLLSKIKAASGKKATGDQADIASLQKSLTDLEQNRPADVILPTLFYEDINAETLAVNFAVGWPSASLWSDEGGLVIGSNGMNDENLMKFVALLNRLWDGHQFERSRLTVKSASLKGRRFTVSLMMQPLVMARMLGACGGATRGMGFVARNLITWPVSTIGQRLYRDPPADMSASHAFNARVTALLDMKLRTEGPLMALDPPPLSLSWEAKREWTSFHDSIEGELSRIGEFGDMPDIGSKIAENAARMAGLFHVFVRGPEGEIAANAMQGAIAVVSWHLDEARRVIGASERPQEIADAELLFEWLLRQEAKPIDPRDILRLGPGRLRDKKRRDAALKILGDKNWVLESGNPARLTINSKASGAS
jgi:hypothetical protein